MKLTSKLSVIFILSLMLIPASASAQELSPWGVAVSGSVSVGTNKTVEPDNWSLGATGSYTWQISRVFYTRPELSLDYMNYHAESQLIGGEHPDCRKGGVGVSLGIMCGLNLGSDFSLGNNWSVYTGPRVRRGFMINMDGDYSNITDITDRFTFYWSFGLNKNIGHYFINFTYHQHLNNYKDGDWKKGARNYLNLAVGYRF